ncbi:YkgJ family cysteine cluster protein [Neptuniibacter halophilus]|uniref:YkgJ family cysteine cluster protein n=1 Tax=Neptuniibacter halophilus TaxID=651666 RepID=UPI0025731420|nr:YkgJ family cysteine cluster protein [Neptuniibacter halophilus]
MNRRIAAANVDDLKTWVKYNRNLCQSCRGTCCSLPVEVRFSDLVRMGVVDEFEADEPAKKLAKRLMKEGIVGHFNHKTEIYTLARYANDDCIYLDQRSRLCQIYLQRPETCRNHPQIGPKPNHCAYQPK